MFWVFFPSPLATLSEYSCICLRIHMWPDWRHLDDPRRCLPVASVIPQFWSSCWPSPAVQSGSHMVQLVHRCQGTHFTVKTFTCLVSYCSTLEIPTNLSVLYLILFANMSIFWQQNTANNVCELVALLSHFILLIQITVAKKYMLIACSVLSVCFLTVVPAALHLPVFAVYNSLSASMAGLQRAVAHACDARCSGDLDRQGSHPHQREAAGGAAGFLQIPATEHQAPRRRRAPHLVGTSLKLFSNETNGLFLKSFFLMLHFVDCTLSKRLYS